MKEKKLNIQIITLSDRASKGEYEDISGKIIKEAVEGYFTEKKWIIHTTYDLIPDDAVLLKNKLVKSTADLIFTSGGTGIGPRDITVDVVKDLLDKEIPGIMEMIRVKYGQEKPNALLSRGVAGVMEETLIYTLPGSAKAAKEYMDEILKTLEHTIYMLHGIDVH